MIFYWSQSKDDIFNNFCTSSHFYETILPNLFQKIILPSYKINKIIKAFNIYPKRIPISKHIYQKLLS